MNKSGQSPKAVALPLLLALLTGCAPASSPTRVEIIEGLGLFESLIPVPADSIIGLYERYDPATFHAIYKNDLELVQQFIDSLNTHLDEASRIDTLAIDHAIENFGNAARIGKTIFISSSYFFLFNDPAVVRSVVTHEFGHIYFEKLTKAEREILDHIWRELQERALFYIFRDGEYSENAKFGGHPDESPAELFASAFNLFNNKQDELNVRLRYVSTEHHQLVERLRNLVVASTLPTTLLP
ncbi:MAG: hypothetical protein KF749_04945 [Bacteroidetes bacterium]|nr:hypothetical protein [Bacteroidota bacterium]MCW5896517.1 hypothetical protein [Bacteroidota bacterium]